MYQHSLRRTVLFLVLVSLVPACTGRSGNEAGSILDTAPTGQEANTAASGGETPESITAAFIAACVAGDETTAATYLAEETRQAAAALSGPCVGFDDERLQADDWRIIENRVTGETAHVTWEWPERERFVPRYQFTLAQQPDGGWLITNGDPAGTLATPVPTPTVDVHVASDISLDSGLTEEYGFPVPVGAEMGAIAQPGWTFHYTTGVQYTLDDLLNFHLFHLREAGWQIDNGRVERVVDASTEQVIAAGGRWLNGDSSAAVNITVGRRGEIVVRARLTNSHKSCC